MIFTSVIHKSKALSLKKSYTRSTVSFFSSFGVERKKSARAGPARTRALAGVLGGLVARVGGSVPLPGGRGWRTRRAQGEGCVEGWLMPARQEKKVSPMLLLLAWRSSNGRLGRVPGRSRLDFRASLAGIGLCHVALLRVKGFTWGSPPP